LHVPALLHPQFGAPPAALLRSPFLTRSELLAFVPPQILLDVAKEVERIEAEEAAARAAELAEEEARLAAEAAGEEYVPGSATASYSAPAATAYEPAYAAAAAVASAVGETARVLDALRRSPLSLDLPANARGLSTLSSLVSSHCQGSFAGACGAARFLGPNGTLPAPSLHPSRRCSAPVKTPLVPFPPQLDAPLPPRPALTNSPAAHASFSSLFPQSDELIIASTVLLMRVEGMFDAKEMIREDASVSGAAAKEVFRVLFAGRAAAWLKGFKRRHVNGARSDFELKWRSIRRVGLCSRHSPTGR
jgi:hypothetical protein